MSGLLVGGWGVSSTVCTRWGCLPPSVYQTKVPNVTSSHLPCFCRPISLSPGNFEFGITRVMRALEPLGSCLDAPRWHAVLLCLLAMMDQVGGGHC